MAVASRGANYIHLLRAAFAGLLMLSAAACGGNSNPADCSEDGTCDASSAKPDGGSAGNPDGGSGGQWATVDTQNYLELYNFLPRGTFVIQSVDSSDGLLVAKNVDDSLVTAEIDETPGATQGNTSKWEIWHGEMYYKVENAEIGEGTAKHWGFITGSLKTPGGSITAPKTLALSTPYGGATTATVSDMSPLMMTGFYVATFVNAYNRDDATFEKTEPVAGVSTKKYVYSNPYGSRDEWWILDNGFCLKHHLIMNGAVAGGFEVIQAELDTPTYDYVTHKYGKFANQVGEIPPVDSMLKIVEAVSDDVWTAPSGFVPWTAGGIGLMMTIRAINWNGNPVHEVFFSFPPGTDLPAATEDYKTRILQVPGMVLESSFGTDEMGYIWDYSNRNATDCGNGNGYYNYRVNTLNLGDAPSNPSQVVITFTRLICV